MNGEKIRDLLIERLADAKKQGKSALYVATKEMGLSGPGFLYDCLAGRRQLSKRILDWMGIELEQKYVKKKVASCQSESRVRRPNNSASKSPKGKRKAKQAG